MRPLEASPVCRFCGHSNANRLPAAAYHLPPGTVLAQRYLVGNVLGEGGFGITYIGLDTTLSKRVAVKEFYPSGTASRANGADVAVKQGKEDFFRAGVERFLVEAKSVAALSDEDGIVDVLDYFQANNTAYIVMEYLEGETLKDYVNHRSLFQADRLIALMMPMMRSLKAMHARGVIHRDISPDNIMLTKNGKLKLMDFGSARYYTNEQQSMSIVLKQGFAPEEQYRRNGRQGPHTDVYALCATIYACITGRVPPNSLDRLAHDTLQPPSRLGVRISPPQENALMYGLATQAQNRCPDMETLMRLFNRREPVYAPPRQNVSKPQPAEKKSKAPVIAVIVAAVMIAALIVTVILIFANRGSGSSAPAETPSTAVPATEPYVPTTEYHPVETTEEPTTEEPTTEEPTTEEPPTEEPTKSEELFHTLTRNQINSKVDEIRETYNRVVLYIDNQKTVGDYAYVKTYDGCLWVATPNDSMKDSDDEKTWYFFDEKGKLFFIFENTRWTQYRYYIYEDEIIRYIVGKSEDAQTTYDYNDFRISAIQDAKVAEAYKAYYYVKGNTWD